MRTCFTMTQKAGCLHVLPVAALAKELCRLFLAVTNQMENAIAKITCKARHAIRVGRVIMMQKSRIFLAVVVSV